jgi:Flp pilus assembly protein TadB
MTRWLLMSSVLAGALAWCGQGDSARELAVLRAVVPSRSSSPRAHERAQHDGLSPVVRRTAVACAAVLVLVLLPDLWGCLVAGVAGFALDAWLARQPNRAQVAAADRLRRQLPLALELVSAALVSGATTATALELAADGCGPPISGPLREVAVSLRLGAGPDEAWRTALGDPSLRPLGRLALRSTASGAAMAAACHDLAAQEREHRVVEGQVAVRRAGVLTTLPLALCFLPSFVLVGVVPIVVGLLQSLAI